MKKLLFALILIFVMASTGCGKKNEPAALDPQRPKHSADVVQGSTQGKIVELALEDLAKLLNITKNKILLKNVEEVTWNDGSLGYPEEGYNYTQALVEGYRIILYYSGQHYEYHTNKRNLIKLNPKATEQFKQ